MERTVVRDAEWILQHLSDDWHIFDCSWALPDAGRDTKKEFLAEAISERAKFFDVDTVATPHDHLVHMMPSTTIFEACMSDFGVNPTDTILLYDRSSDGRHSTSRVWYTLKPVFGHPGSVYIIKNGIDGWKLAGGCTCVPSGNKPTRTRYQVDLASYHPELVWSFEQVRDCDPAEIQVVDARAASRFSGEQDEPRPVLFRGHVRGALNVPYIELDRLGERMDIMRPFVSYCGSGLTSCVVNLAAWEAGAPHPGFLYDASFGEWGNNPSAIAFSEAVRMN